MERPVLKLPSLGPIVFLVLETLNCLVELPELTLHVDNLGFHLLYLLVLAKEFLLVIFLLLLELVLHVGKLTVLRLEAGQTQGSKALKQLFEFKLLAVECLHLFLASFETVCDFFEEFADSLSFGKDFFDILIARTVMVFDLCPFGLILTIFDDSMVAEFNLLQINIIMERSNSAAT